MLEVIQKKRFVKSLKKYRTNKAVLLELEKVMGFLIHEKAIPTKYRDHLLQGNFKGIREIHLKADDLLLYVKVKDESLILIDIGSHSDLFG